jgi:tetratricopeptide (TPR) repeat protein
MAYSDVESEVLSCNKQAMDSLKADHFEQAHKLLNHAEVLLRSQDFPTRSKLQAITFNNQGCFYKRVGQLDEALEYLREALKLEEEGATDIVNRAGTLLNVCAILSQTNQHEEALQVALRALRLLKAEADASTNGVTTLVIAYHNTGVELEFLQQRQEAALTFKQGWDLARERLGLRHSLTASMKVSYMNATEGALKSLVKPTFRSKGGLFAYSRGSPRNTSAKAVDRRQMRVSVPPPKITRMALPSLSREQPRKRSNDYSLPPWVDPNKLTSPEKDWYKQANQLSRVAPPTLISEKLSLGIMRFISGGRKQPMHKQTATLRSISPRKRKITKKDAVSPEAKQRRKSKRKMPSLNHKIDLISGQLSGLQQKLNDFEVKYQQLKEVSPDVTS